MNDRLPDNTRDVLVFTDWGEMYVDWLDQEECLGKKFWAETRDTVTHWAELPDGPVDSLERVR